MNSRSLTYLRAALIIAYIATLGSLYFSEIAGYAPCKLCWFQRIGMYPLTALFTVALLRKDKNVTYYAWPLVIFGGLVGLYHNLLYYKIIPDTYAPCSLGVSCTTKFIEWAGFVTIPFLSFVAFVAIAILLNKIQKGTNE